jgi:microcystin-dependent protein
MFVNTNPGIIKYIAGSVAPTGTLLCDASAVSRTTYARLFAKVGVTFGAGDGVNTFNLPDRKNYLSIGAGTTYTLADTGGETTHTLVTNEIPSHTHTQDPHTHGVTDAGHTHTTNGFLYEVDAQASSGSSNALAQGTINSATTGVTINNATAVNQNAGSGTAHNNLHPYLGMIVVITY